MCCAAFFFHFPRVSHSPPSKLLIVRFETDYFILLGNRIFERFAIETFLGWQMGNAKKGVADRHPNYFPYACCLISQDDTHTLIIRNTLLDTSPFPKSCCFPRLCYTCLSKLGKFGMIRRTPDMDSCLGLLC